MANEYKNKVVYGGNTLIDLTGDDVTAADVASGKKFHLPSGEPAVGTGSGGFDYDDLVNATRYKGAGSLGMVNRPAFTGVVNLTGTTLFPFAFTGMDITEVHGPNVTNIVKWNLGGGNNDSGVFASCALLEVVDLPALTDISSNMFEDCLSLRSVNLPSVASALYHSAFNDCKSLEQIALPKMSGNVDRSFGGCSALKKVDLNNPTNFSINVFQNNTLLETLIIRRTASITTLANVNAFSGTPFASGGSGGTIYIPKALYDHLGDGTSLDYKAATNWSTIDGYGTITWAQIEGSIYETQYADGTPIE